MLDLGTQLRDYLDETASAVELEDIFAVPTGDGPVRPLVPRTPSRPLAAWSYTAAAALITVLLIGGMAWLVRGGQPEDPTDGTVVPTTATTTVPPIAMTPREVIESHFAAYNAMDVASMMAFYSEDSVITGHPIEAYQAGLVTIERVARVDMLVAAEFNAYIISNLEVSGDIATWDHMWTDSQGFFFCMQGHTAVVRNGVILSWTWPALDSQC